MEAVATIDWKDSRFEKDELYEHINAPQWIDLSANYPPLDDSWFCRPDCNHPKTADDFIIKTIPNPSKYQRSVNVSEIHGQDDRNQCNTAVKKRGNAMNKILTSTKLVQDCENQNPNFQTPIDHVKSIDAEAPRKLKSTFSARNLFAGNNIVNQITEFCNELKRLATRKEGRDEHEEEKEVAQKKPEARVLQERDIQKKPLLKTTKHEDMDKTNSNGKEKLRRQIRNDGLEKSPITEKTKNTRVTDQDGVLQIRAAKATPPKTFRSRHPGGIHGHR